MLFRSGTELVFSQYNSEDDSSDSYIENAAVVDLSQELLIANQYYHIRLSWTENPMPINGKVYLYINGVLKAENNCTPSALVADALVIGSRYNTALQGFLIEELVCYSKHFEVLALAGSDYGYAKNNI